MTRKDTGMIMAILQAAFPSYYRNVSQADATAAVNLWAEMFEDDDAREVAAAVKALIATKVDGYPPTIGAVKEKLGEIRAPDKMKAQEAWALTEKAAAGNLKWDKLPPLVQRAIGSENVLREWGMIDTDTFSTVIYSQFVKAYKTYEKREDDMKAIPSSVMRLISSVADRMKLTDGKNTRGGEI